MKNFHSVLKLLDFSKVSYGFHIDGNEFYKTSLGGSLYLMMTVFLTYFIVNTFIDFISKNNYNLMKIDEILPSPPEINLVSLKLNYGFSNLKNNKPLEKDMLDRYFILKLNHINSINNTKENINDINLSKCMEHDFLNTYNTNSEFIKFKKYSYYYCLSASNYSIKGSYNNEYFSYIEFSLYLNRTAVRQDNTTFRNNILLDNEIKIIFKYFDYGINFDDYHNPIRSFESEIFSYIDFGIVKICDLDFSLNKFEDDKDILLPGSKTETFPWLSSTEKFFYYENERNINFNDDQLLFKFYIKSSNNRTKLKRIYKKLPEMLSQISGLANNILFFVFLLTRFYDKFKSKEQLINLILKFKEKLHKENSINKKIIDLNILFKEKFKENRQNDIKKRKNSKKVFNNQKSLFDRKNLINDSNENKNIEMNEIDICFRSSPIKKQSIKYYNFKNNQDIPENENIKIHINKFNCNLNKINEKNSLEIFKENTQNEISQNSFFSNIYKDNSLQRMMNPDQNLISKNNSKSFKFQNNKFDSTIRKNSLNDTILRDIYNKKINNTDNNMFNNINTNLVELKKNFYLEESQINNSIHYSKNLKENEYKKRYNISKSRTSVKKSLSAEKLFRTQLKKISGNSLVFNFSFFEIICKPLYACRKSAKQKFNLYDKAYNNINNHLHIYSYLKSIQEIDVIKNALFSKNEMKIIDFISKPIISEEDKQEYLINEDLKRDKLINEKNLNEVIEAFEKILKKEEIKDFSKNLLKSLSFQLNNLFDE